MKHRIIQLIMLLIMCALSLPARAVVPEISSPLHQETASYTMQYLGLEMGDIALDWKEDKAHYRMSAHIVTSGLARIFSKQTRTISVYGNKVGAAYVPVSYEAKVMYPSKEKTVSMTFQNNELAQYLTVPENDTTLTKQQQRSARDPLSTLLELTHYAASSALHSGFFSAVVFDGKRLNRIYALPTTAKATEKQPCGAVTCHYYSLHRKPLAGYSAEKMARYEKGEPPLMFVVAPESRFPHQMEINTTLGTLSAIRGVKK